MSRSEGGFFSAGYQNDNKKEIICGGAVRPVIILKSNLTAEDLEKTDTEIEEKWSFKNELGTL